MERPGTGCGNEAASGRLPSAYTLFRPECGSAEQVLLKVDKSSADHFRRVLGIIAAQPEDSGRFSDPRLASTQDVVYGQVESSISR